MVLKTLNIESPNVDPAELKGDPHHLAPLLAAILKFSKPQRVLDATAGSGVTARTAQAVGIPADVHDLHDPAHATDLFSLEPAPTYDLVVYHPDLWCARATATHPHDLGAPMEWDAYAKLNAQAVEHLAATLRPAGKMVVIAPIARRKGTVRSLARALECAFGPAGEPELIHPHPECRSRGSMYGKRFIPIAHDQVLLYTKEEILGGQTQVARSDVKR